MNSLEVAYEFKKVSKQLYGRESAVDVTRLTVSGALYAHNKNIQLNVHSHVSTSFCIGLQVTRTGTESADRSSGAPPDG